MSRRKRPAPRPKAPDPAEASGIYPYLTAFLEDSAAKGLSPRTVEVREVNLRRFLRWCRERGLERPQEITRPILERYRRHLYHYRKADGEPLAFATQQQRLVPIKAFFAWLTRSNHILYNPASELELPRTHRRLPKHILTPDEITRIRRQTAVQGELGIRDRAIIETFYSTGIRRSELINLKLYDADTRNGILMVREGKGRKDRLVPLGKRAAQWIERYRDEVRPGLVMEPDADSHASCKPEQTPRRAPTADPWPAPVELSGSVPYARRPASRLPAIPVWITPHPPPGGYGRASNITPGYAPSLLLVRRAAGRPARLDPCPHNRRYVKCPQVRPCPTRACHQLSGIVPPEVECSL